MRRERKKGDMDMLHGSLWDKLVLFAIPLALTGILQQLFNAADVAVLGQLVGKNAIAAVGNNISLIGLLVNLFLGLSLGANVVIAQNIGAKRFSQVKTAVHTAFLLALIVGAVIALLGELLTDPILDLMSVPDAVRDMAETYLRVYLAGMPVIGLYNFESAIFRSRGDTKTPLMSLLVASILNLILNLVFVLVMDWGVAGVAFATVIANALSALILLRALCRSDSIIHVDLRALSMDRKCLGEIVRIGLPAGIQGMVFSLSNLLIQSAINSLGPEAMAASAAAFTIEINVYCFVNAFGQATTTFVGQNYGAGKLFRCRRATWEAMGLNALFTVVMTVLVLAFGKEMLAFFNADPEVISLGYTRLLYIVGPEIICVLLDGLSGALRGYGISMPPALLTLLGVCGVRITWVYTLFRQYPTYDVLMATYPVSWAVTILFICAAYRFYMKHLKPVPKWRERLHEREGSAQ